MRTKARSGQARAAIYRARLRREVAESLAQPKPKMTEAEAFKGFTDEEPPTPDEAREAIKDAGGF